tara:strand:- start:214 stop:396 length:183 start_codon:yes stop_codon:yes gene_type:complete
MYNHNEYHRKYYEKNKEYLRAYQRAYYYKKKHSKKKVAKLKHEKPIQFTRIYGEYTITFD